MKNLDEIVNDLVAYVFSRHKVDVDTIKIDDYDLDRVYINDGMYTLRMWDIYTDGKVEYTLYKTVGNSGMHIGAGKARTSKRFVRLLQEDAERKYLEYMKTQNDEE